MAKCDIRNTRLKIVLKIYQKLQIYPVCAVDTIRILSS